MLSIMGAALEGQEEGGEFLMDLRRGKVFTLVRYGKAGHESTYVFPENSSAFDLLQKPRPHAQPTHTHIVEDVVVVAVAVSATDQKSSKCSSGSERLLSHCCPGAC